MAEFKVEPTNDITSQPTISNDTVSQSLDISKSLGIDVDPVKNFTPNEDLNNKISAHTKVTRSIASESDANASLIKPDAEKLSGLEKWGRNASIQLEIDSLRRVITDKGMLNVASENGQGLGPDDQFELDNAELRMEELQQERNNLKLTGVEEVLTGDVISVFNDTYKATKESPWVVGGAAVGGLAAGGPAGSWLAFNVVTAGGNAAYQLNAATVQTYNDLADATDDLGNPLDHGTKKGIAFASGVVQSGLELTGDLALTLITGAAGKGLSKIGEKTGSKIISKFGAKFTAKELNEKLLSTAVKNPGFRKYLRELGIKMAKGAPMEAITEVLQDNTGNFAKALGETWTQDGASVGKAFDKFAEDFDLAQNAETALRAGLTGAVVTGGTDVVINKSVPKAWDGAKSIYKKATGKNINLAEGDNVTITDSETKTFNTTKDVSTEVVDNTYKMVDGRPVGLDANQLTTLGIILPSINEVRGTNLNLDPDVVTQMQSEQAREIGLDEVYMDKESIQEWADTPEKRDYVADMLGGEKGVYVDGQRIRLTREQYFGMQKFGNVKYISENTAVTSDGATISDIKKSVDNKKARSIPVANNIQASDSINPIPGEDVVDTQPKESLAQPPVDTTNLGMDSTDQDIASTLKTKAEADAYIARLEAEANKKIEGKLLYHRSDAVFNDYKGDAIWTYNVDQPNGLNYGRNLYTYELDKDAKIVESEDLPDDIVGNDINTGHFSDVTKKYLKDNDIAAVLRHSVNGVEQILIVDKSKAKLQNNRITQVNQMKERVSAIRETLQDAPQAQESDVNFNAIADESVDGYGEFGIIPENIYNAMTPKEQEDFKKLVKETKESLKANLKMSVVKELDKTASMQERNANHESETKTLDEIANDPNSKIVDWFLADDTMKIDPDSLTNNQKELYIGNDLINKRNIYKKGGAKLADVAAGFDVTPDKLLEVLSTSPSSIQAYKAQMIIEKARNKKEARRSATFNQDKINKTLDDKISFKRKLLEAIIKGDPRSGLRLAYSIMIKGSKTNIEKSSINAQEVTDNTRIGDLKPSTYLNASRRHQNRANESLLKARDMETAAVEVEKSMIADELFKASRKTKERVELILDAIIKQSKDSDLRQKLESTNHYEHFKALLNMLGLDTLTPKQVQGVSDMLIEWQEKGLEPESGLPDSMQVPVVLASKNEGEVNVNDLSLEQIRTINSYINQIITDSENIISDRKKNNQYFSQDIATKAREDVKNNPNADGRKAETHAPGGEGFIRKTIDFITGTTDHIRGMSEMVDWYEFGEKSIPRTILHMIRGVGEFAKQGGTFVRDKLWDSSMKLLMDTAGADTIKRIKSYSGERIEVPEFTGSKALGEDGKISKLNLISILLIKGSADGDQRLAKLGLPENVVKVIQLYLHKDDINFVKAVYKVMKFLQPGITHVEKTLKGYDDVEYVDGDSFKWYGEDIEGGYVHFSYLDNDGGTKAFDDFDKKLSQMVGDGKSYVNNESARGYTKEGFKKSRVENVDKLINLDFDNLMNKTIGNVVTNNTMLIPIVRSMQILNDESVSKSLRTVMGKNGLQVFKNQVISAANGLVMDLESHETAILTGINKWVSGVSRNYMTALILGNLSSVFSNTISWNNVVFSNIDTKNYKRSFKFPLALMSSLFIPGVHSKLKANLEGFIPELTTTKENYQMNDLDSFTLFKKSKSSNIIVRKLSDFMRGTSEFYFERVMGLFDNVGKTAYASILLNEKLSELSVEQKNKMTKDDIKNYVSGAISDELNRLFPSRDSTNIALMQKHPIGKQFFLFFNDSRVQLNNIYFKRFRDIIRSVTFFPKRVKEKGFAYAFGKGAVDVATNAAILHLQSSIILALLRSFRGEDEEGDKKTNKSWLERVYEILKVKLLDPFTTAKAAGEMLPVIGSLIRYYESDGKYGYVNIPILQWGKDSFDASMGLYESEFNWDNMTDSERKAVAGFLTGVIPNLPMSPIKSYVLDDVTAFETGLQSIPEGIGILRNISIGNLMSVFDDTAQAMVEEIERANDPDVEEELSNYLTELSNEQYTTLLTFPRGRAVLKRLLDLGQVSAISPDDVNDIVFMESKGDPNAYNDKTGATGIYQFLESTWNRYLAVDKDGNLKYPMTEGLSRAYGKDEVPEGEVDGRLDVRQASRMMYIMHNEIAKDFISAGIRPTRDNIYMGHHFGEGPAVKVWQADDDVPLKDAYLLAFKNKKTGVKFFNKAVAANPWMQSDMTVGETKEKLGNLLDRLGREARLSWEEKMGQDFSVDNLNID